MKAVVAAFNREKALHQLIVYSTRLYLLLSFTSQSTHLDDGHGHGGELHVSVGLVLVAPRLELGQLPRGLVKLVHRGPGVRTRHPGYTASSHRVLLSHES